LNEIHDPLKAVAMVMQSDEAAIALVGIDSVFASDDANARARESITSATKTPGSHILVGASHTHGGGPVASCFTSEADPKYVDLVVSRVAEAVISAYQSLHAAELGDGIGHEPSISFNRRFRMRDGRQATHPGKDNPDIVRPSGPIDPDVGVVAAQVPGGELLGLSVNFACHATVMGGNGFSADYIHHLRETRRRHYKNPRLPVGFLLGAAGDVTQVDNQRPGREFVLTSRSSTLQRREWPGRVLTAGPLPNWAQRRGAPSCPEPIAGLFEEIG
jgi:neutral ceramidase